MIPVQTVSLAGNVPYWVGMCEPRGLTMNKTNVKRRKVFMLSGIQTLKFANMYKINKTQTTVKGYQSATIY